MTEIDRAELRRLAVSAGDTWQGTIGVAPKDVLTLLDALDEAERERDKASAEVARQQALRVENGKRFEQMRSERTAAIDRAEAAEAAVERVREREAAERDAALARIAELERELALLQVPEGYPKRPSARAWAAILDRANVAEARIAEAAKLHRRRDDLGYRWGGGPVCDGCGDEDGWASKWPCPTAVALGLNEGEVAGDEYRE